MTTEEKYDLLTFLGIICIAVFIICPVFIKNIWAILPMLVSIILTFIIGKQRAYLKNELGINED
jgi:hypothetical protein